MLKLDLSVKAEIRFWPMMKKFSSLGEEEKECGSKRRFILGKCLEAMHELVTSKYEDTLEVVVMVVVRTNDPFLRIKKKAGGRHAIRTVHQSLEI